MKSDPIVDEIRAVRKAHAAQFNNDLNAICADLKKQEKNCKVIVQFWCGFRGFSYAKSHHRLISYPYCYSDFALGLNSV